MDVAAQAGVSFKTVSRVVNNEPHVRPAIRDRVMQAIDELGYKPNVAARQLAGHRSYLISLIVVEMTMGYLAQILYTAAMECRRFGYHLVPETLQDGESIQDAIQRILANSHPDGIILPAPLSYDPDVVAAIERSRTPLVRLAGVGDMYGHTIPVHERSISAALVTHLIELGHRRIGVIAPPPRHLAAQERLLGYRDALDAAGLAYDPAIAPVGNFRFADGVRLGAELLAMPDRPTAIFATNDSMALGVLTTATKAGMRVPEDIAIAGFDDLPASRLVFPPLTTVRQPIPAIARAAVLALVGESFSVDDHAHELILRSSTTGSREVIYDRIVW